MIECCWFKSTQDQVLWWKREQRLSGFVFGVNNQRIKTTPRKEKQEVLTYQPNVGLNQEQSALVVIPESVAVINYIIQENILEETVAAYEK